MRIRSIILLAAAISLSSLTSDASVIGASYGDDGDGAIVCPVYSVGATDTLYVYGDQYWGPGHVLGTIDTDSPEDPTITLDNSLDNDTAFTWTAFRVNVQLNHVFSILTSPYPVAYTPADWTASIISQPVNIGGGIYQGTIDFYSGTPVGIGDTLEFRYKINFSGLTTYEFCQEFIPIPEPGTFSLVLGGALLLGAAKRRQA
jgi:hypothetical protein